MTQILRTLHPGDLGWIISQHGEIYTREFQFDPYFEIHIAAKVVAFCEKAVPFDTFWMVEIDGERAGSIAISKIADEVAFLNFVLVSTKFRGQGVAQALVNKAIDHARTHGMRVVQLETYSCLQNARKLYKKLGFAIIEPPTKIEKFGQTFDQEFWEYRL
ncbi:MAG: GNAT family N-acetyltransferase [Anaerolineae bacterium]|nr:GNAT family N-acetyltransferase [Anaerolineae bacterium]